jgi:hypothetical protein
MVGFGVGRQRLPIRPGHVEGTHLAQVAHREAPPESPCQICGEPLEQRLSVAGPRRAFLLSLDDALADEPVGRCHDRIDRAGRCTPRVLDRTHDVGEEIIVAGLGLDRLLLLGSSGF